MSIEVKIPNIGESITEVTLASWLKNDGDYVEEGENLCEIESDKASVELPAESSGVLKIQAQEGDEIEVGATIATLEEGEAPKHAPKQEKEEPKKETSAAQKEVPKQQEKSAQEKKYPSPAARKVLDEKGISPDDLQGSGKDGRITKADALAAKKAPSGEAHSKEASSAKTYGSRETRREKMSRLRKTIAKRLVDVKNETAMLTTFNEVDMSAIMDIRKKYKEAFKKKHDIGLGFMSFFTKACTMALKDFPAVNAQIDGNEILFHDYADVGIAVSTPKGLVVPVIRNAESKSLAEIEKSIMDLALRARDGKITIDEMQGGTFTITNGGVFGSMLSTPIINAPQSAILGMHNIVERPVAVNGEVVVRPVMYLALSYDHRIIDGRESVSFLKTVKELLEDPARLLLDV